MGYWGVDRFENSDRHDKRNLSFVFWVSLPDEPGATADDASTALRLPALRETSPKPLHPSAHYFLRALYKD
jgi:hypothetical protein